MNNYKKVAENPQVFIDEIKAMHAALPKMMLHGKKVQVVLSDEVASMSMTLIDATIEELCENDIHNIAGAHAMLLLCISAISNGIALCYYCAFRQYLTGSLIVDTCEICEVQSAASLPD